jgi:hypothetical protein
MSIIPQALRSIVAKFTDTDYWKACKKAANGFIELAKHGNLIVFY